MAKTQERRARQNPGNAGPGETQETPGPAKPRKRRARHNQETPGPAQPRNAERERRARQNPGNAGPNKTRKRRARQNPGMPRASAGGKTQETPGQAKPRNAGTGKTRKRRARLNPGTSWEPPAPCLHVCQQLGPRLHDQMNVSKTPALGFEPTTGLAMIYKTIALTTTPRARYRICLILAVPRP